MSPRRLRLMQLINTFSVGGAERHLFDLVRHLPKDQFDITVAFFKEEAEEARSLVVDFRSLGVEVVDLSDWLASVARTSYIHICIEQMSLERS
jgi:hypothetical protein